MLRLSRLILIVVVTGALVAACLAALAMVGNNIIHKTAIADESTLAPLSSKILSGSTIYDDQGNVLAVEQGPQLSEPVPLSKIPKVLINAVLDTEDVHFYTHGGFDIPSTLRAAASTASGDQFQGGSTIPQQLVKQLYVGSERKLSRKIKEAVLASRLEKVYTKNEILNAYLNTVYLGSGATGVQAASFVFFDKDVSQLTLPEAALLAGNIQSPSAYDPISNPTGARIRRSQVLARMLKVRSINKAQYAAANVAPLPNHTTSRPQPTTSNSNLYVNQVIDELLAAGSPLGKTKTERYNALYEGGLKIYTNYDPTMTAQALGAVTGDVPPAATSQGLTEALAAIDPATGAVRAIVGGNTQFDLATQGTRQPGSGFKIFTLLAALEQGYSISSQVDATAPCAVAFPPSATGTAIGNYDLIPPNLGGPAKGKPATNDEGPGSGGKTTIENATAQSYNCAFIRLAHEIKLTSVISMAHSLGITAYLPAVPAMVLGADPASPLEMAAAYAAVADNGVYHTPSFISRIVNGAGQLVYNGLGPGKQVFSPAIAAQATTAFRDVVTSGTGKAEANVPGHDVAGKTGTATGPTDAWFNGYTPQLAVSVWMGNPNKEVPMVVPGLNGSDCVPTTSCEVYGGTIPAQTFRDFMASALQGKPNAPLNVLPPQLIPPGRPVSSPALSADDKIHPPPPPPPPAPTPGPGAVVPAATQPPPPVTTATYTPPATNPPAATPPPPATAPPATAPPPTAAPPPPAAPPVTAPPPPAHGNPHG
ncbi:MAG: penicillin-binding protein [Acidimicrobiaceae bacterium]|nr:penicillin-binding protein [Acidimicrobiaceae bacterium]